MKTFNIEVGKKILKNGAEISALILGEMGRGRFEALIPAPDDITDGDLVSIGTTRTGRPRINRGGDDHGWLMRVSTKGAYIRGGVGSVMVPRPNADKVAVIAGGNGAFGDAGRIGYWDDLLISVHPDQGEGILLRVKPTRGNPKFLVVTPEKVHEFVNKEELLLWADTEGEGLDIVVPETLGAYHPVSNEYNGFVKEWKTLSKP